MYRVALIVATLALSSSAFAQTPAPAPTAGATNASNCPKPDDHPGRLASDRQRTGWEKEVQAWQECMRKYVGEVQAKADQAVKVANAAVAESNAVVAEYNNTVKIIQAQVDAAK